MKPRRGSLVGQSPPAPSLGIRDPRVRSGQQALSRLESATDGLTHNQQGQHVFRPGEGLRINSDGDVDLDLEVVIKFTGGGQ